MTCRKLLITSMYLVGLASYADRADADLIPLINPGAEAYPGTATININPGGVEPIETTGWIGTFTGDGRAASQTLANNANSGARRFAVGAVTDASGVSSAAPETVLLFQETDRVVAQGDEYGLDFFGRGFFNFTNDVDFLTSFYGYLDAGVPVQVDTLTHETVLGGVWSEASHSLTVGAGSPLIGKNLTIGFFTTSGDFAEGTPNTGAFSSVDDIALILDSPFAPGDVDGNGQINLADVQIIANHFRNTGATRAQGDLSSDGIVDFADFQIWKEAAPGLASGLDLNSLFNQAVPEPASIGLACLAALLVLSGSRWDRK